MRPPLTDTGIERFIADSKTYQREALAEKAKS